MGRHRFIHRHHVLLLLLVGTSSSTLKHLVCSGCLRVNRLGLLRLLEVEMAHWALNAQRLLVHLHLTLVLLLLLLCTAVNLLEKRHRGRLGARVEAVSTVCSKIPRCRLLHHLMFVAKASIANHESDLLSLMNSGTFSLSFETLPSGGLLLLFLQG